MGFLRFVRGYECGEGGRSWHGLGPFSRTPRTTQWHLDFRRACASRARGNPFVKVSFVVRDAAQSELYEFWPGAGAAPFFEGGATKCEMRGSLVSGENIRHVAASGKRWLAIDCRVKKMVGF
jgi:hypothetical protein